MAGIIRSCQFLRRRKKNHIFLVVAICSIILTVPYIFFGLYVIQESFYATQTKSALDEVKFSEKSEDITSILDETMNGQNYKETKISQPSYSTKPTPTIPCERIPEFGPDIDTQKIYSSLEFETTKLADGKRYWNDWFEERYENIKTSNNTPYLKVFVIPHSHTDPGWLTTFEGYFDEKVRDILNNVMDKLEELPLMKFQWSEISFLDYWFKQTTPERRKTLKKLVTEGRLEIATGGWTMTDEAGVNLYSMIDQLVEGHQWVKRYLGVIPKTSWSVDPFGHGSTLPYILNKAGLDAMIIQRIHYAWKKYLSKYRSGDFQWVQRWDVQNRYGILCHNNPFDLYSIKYSCGPHPDICLNFDFQQVYGIYSDNHKMTPITKENLKEKAELLLEQYGKIGSLYPHNVAMISLGDDFRYNFPAEWNQQYDNYLAIFNYVNENSEKYKAKLQFGTISEYFQAVRERSVYLPTLSGDFFVYGDVYANLNPAYWSGYFGTRPYWKKFYRETENCLRSAEILYTFATALARQGSRLDTLVMLQSMYEKLEVARQWLALFSHHDATTGTSQTQVMKDYGRKLLEAKQNSMEVQKVSATSIIFGQAKSSKLALNYEQETFEQLPKKVLLNLTESDPDKKVVLFNSLGWKRSHLEKLVVTTPNVKVIGPNGENVPAQLNPTLDFNSFFPFISDTTFELSFIVSLPPLSISTFTIQKVQAGTPGIAQPAVVSCKNCTGSSGPFDLRSFDGGDIQLGSNRLDILFDHDTGLLLGIKLIQKNVSMKAKVTFGIYQSIHYKSGAYLLKLDTNRPEPLPFIDETSQIFLIAGPLSSELFARSKMLLVTTKIMHTGGKLFENGIYIQSKVNLGETNGELFMRLDTDLNSNIETFNGDTVGPTPTFYTDQNGFTVEKRTKVSKIGLEGNYYPVNTLTYLQDEHQRLRFSVLVDRTHGFSSFETGRLETIVDRRIVHDDNRGVAQGVMDNSETISNYVLLLEKLSPSLLNNYDNNLLTIPAHQASLALNYPPTMFLSENYPMHISFSPLISLMSKPFPCDTHLINLRTVSEDKEIDTDSDQPSSSALMIIQKLAYYCTTPYTTNGSATCEQGNSQNSPFFHHGTTTNLVNIKTLAETTLTGIENTTLIGITHLHDLVGAPFDIKSVILNF